MAQDHPHFFLRILHGHSLAIATPPLTNLANLAIVGDRFDALSCLAQHVHKKKYIQAIVAKTKGKSPNTFSEEKARERLLTGVLLDYPPWVTKYSAQLIYRNSVRWGADAEETYPGALWWDLPEGLEGEILFQFQLPMVD